MPRGIPNAKRDDAAFKFTSFHVPLLTNPKHVGSAYLKNDSQLYWTRNASRRTDDVAGPSDGRRGSKIIVIHPGARWLRIGRGSDVKPLSVPNFIARKHTEPVPPPTYISRIPRPRNKGKTKEQASSAQNGDEYAIAIPDDPVEGKIASIALSLRDRMRFYKLRVTANAASIATSFNEQFEPEVLADKNDPFRIRWATEAPQESVLVGEKALRLSDPQKLGYTLKRPFYCSNFNMRDYDTKYELLNDIETLWRTTLKEQMNILPKDYKDYSVVLVIPDIWDRGYVQDLVNVLLVSMGFKQLCAQQESLAATYGAGISNACVIDIGATKTSVACVDDGLVISDTRINLNTGGDDITEFLWVLLDRISFPYREIDLARSYDWTVMEDLKSRICTLNESEVALNLYDFVVRRPGSTTKKYGLRAYDEVILAPMCLFEPRVIDFDTNRVPTATNINVTDETVEYVMDRLTSAMLISTQHLMPRAPPELTSTPPVAPSGQVTLDSPAPDLSQPEALVKPDAQLTQSTPSSGVQDVAASEAPKSAEPTAPEGGLAAAAEVPDQPAPASTTQEAGKNQEVEKDVEMEDAVAVAEDIDTKREEDIDVVGTGTSAKTSTATTTASTPVPPEVVEGSRSQTPLQVVPETREPSRQPSDAPLPPPVIPSGALPGPTYLGGLPIDVPFEASKLPLDVAIFNSARAAGGDDKIRKYLQAILVVGGSALLPGMAHALESRLQAIATPLVPNMEKVQIIAPPKDVDPRMLIWKGAAVLGKMDGVVDLWVTPADWEIFGMRGLKERCYFL